MEYYKMFMKVLFKEIFKFKLDIEILYSVYLNQATPVLIENFYCHYNRCAYVYRYGTVNTYFFKDCMDRFFLDYSNVKYLVSSWKTFSKVKVFSLSPGPALDYLGFMLAVLQYDASPPNFEAKVLTKYGAWRNTVTFISETLSEQGTVFEVLSPKLNYQNVKVKQSDILLNYSCGIKLPEICEANIILMMRAINLPASDTVPEGYLLHAIKELVSSLKSESIIFCIDTRPSTALLTDVLNLIPGKFLYGPCHLSVQLPCTFEDLYGNHPVISSRGAFFAWQKSPLPDFKSTNSEESLPLSLKEEALLEPDYPSSPTKSITSPLENDVKVEREATNDDSNLPWKELKSIWKCSSPVNRELLKKLITNDNSLELLNVISSLEEKPNADKKHPLQKSDKTLVIEDTELPNNGKVHKSGTTLMNLNDSKLFSSQPLRQSMSFDNPKIVNCHNLRESNEILNSGSSTASENMASSKFKDQRTGAIPKSTKPMSKQSSIKSDSVNVQSSMSKKRLSKSREIQTDTFQAVSPTSSSVKSLTERIKQLAISIESASKKNDSANHGDTYNSGNIFIPENCHNNMPHSSYNNASYSKQTPNCCMIGQNNFPDCSSRINACLHNTSCFCSYKHSHGCFQHYCAQSMPRCNSLCNSHSSTGNNLGNFTQPNIVIPLQNISEEKLSKIISILKS